MAKTKTNPGFDFERIKQHVMSYPETSRLAIPLTIACFVGIIIGFVTVGFVQLIHFTEDIFFVKGRESLSSLGPYATIVIPAIGGLFVGLIVTYVAPEAKGHGVPEVMKAIALKGGRIRPVVVLAKAIASTLAIGSGASVGREGPIVQVGSALGSSIAQLFRLSETRIKNLVACGAAAGIAGVFNAPIAAVMFALEVILRDFGARALSTVVVSAVSASIISRIYLGDTPAFIVPVYSLQSPLELFLYLGLGVLSAFVAYGFVTVLHKSEHNFDEWKFPEWLKPAIGGLLIGCIGLYYPQIFGSGLHAIEDALHGHLEITLLFTLVLMKILATSISLGSGSSGGVFAPALFIGAVLGGAFGKLFENVFPFQMASSGAYALVGMASVFSAAAHAPVTAILIVFEMTGDYRMILPIMIAVVMATSLSQILRKESIYTIKLKQRGIDIGAIEEARYLGALQVRDAMTENFQTVPRQMPMKELSEKMANAKNKKFIVVNDRDELTGVIVREKMQSLLFETELALFVADDIAEPNRGSCFPDEQLQEAAHYMKQHHLGFMTVMDPTSPRQVMGILKSEDIFHAYTNLTVKHNELVGRMAHQNESASGTIHAHFSLTGTSKFIGKEIREIKIPEGVVLTSIQRGKRVLVPEGKTVLKGRDKIWAVVIPKNKDQFIGWLKDHKLDRHSFFE